MAHDDSGALWASPLHEGQPGRSANRYTTLKERRFNVNSVALTLILA